MTRRGRRIALAVSVAASVMLLAACAEPDLTVGVPSTTTSMALPPATLPQAAPVDAPPVPPALVDSPPAPSPIPQATEEPPEPALAAPPVPVPQPDPDGVDDSEPLPAGPPQAPSPAPPPPAPLPPAPTLTQPVSAVPGLTDSRVRIGVIADIETGGVADERSRSVQLAMLAWAEAVNAAGGLAGRTVEMLTFDAGLFGHEAVVGEACRGDIFALVGSDALLDDEGVEMFTSPECDLVDFPARVHSPRRAASPRTFQAVPVSNEAVNVGALRWVAERQPVRIRSTATFFVDLPTAVIAAERTAEAARGLGFEFVYDPSVTIGESLDLQALAMVAAGVHHVLWDGDTNRLLELLESVAAAGITVGVNCMTACDSALFLEAAGPLANGVLVWSPYLPLREEEHSPELAAYRQWLAVVDPEAVPDTQGVAAWAAARLFEEAARRAIGAGTPSEDADLLTPTAVAEAAAGIVNWHGHGLHAPSNPGTGESSPCGVVMGVSEGSLFRFHPAPPGSFVCSPENLFALEATAQLGLAPSAAGDLRPLSPEPEAVEEAESG